MKKITNEHLEIYKGAYRLAMLDPLRSNATMHFDYCMKAALQAVFDSFQDPFRDMITPEALMEILNRFELDNTLSNRCKAKAALEVIFNFHLRDIAPSSDNSAQLKQSAAEPAAETCYPFIQKISDLTPKLDEETIIKFSDNNTNAKNLTAGKVAHGIAALAYEKLMKKAEPDEEEARSGQEIIEDFSEYAAKYLQVKND